ncbi:hypothetical protein [Sphingosinicella sp. BN140058]|uniref:hypothetical protein n=1 Tax=Sphingosinicella sp. BN140058 TaxID=1892855 RepID=UPI00101147B3|nr:hypothetical protein [Sphingosinicella sp. BN140058]QAY80390.1 hypothetical protein ETR14_27505 [Sphingosinicella sp. BN140058]
MTSQHLPRDAANDREAEAVHSFPHGRIAASLSDFVSGNQALPGNTQRAVGAKIDRCLKALAAMAPGTELTLVEDFSFEGDDGHPLDLTLAMVLSRTFVRFNIAHREDGSLAVDEFDIFIERTGDLRILRDSIKSHVDLKKRHLDAAATEDLLGTKSAG